MQTFHQICKGGSYQKVINAINDGHNNWNEGLLAACEIKNYDIMMLMFEKGATKLRKALETTIKDQNINFLIYLIDNYNVNLDHAISLACEYDNMEIIKLLSKVARDLNFGLISACQSGNFKAVEYLLSLDEDLDVNCAFNVAYDYDHFDIMKLLIDHGATDFKNLSALDIQKLIKEYGVNPRVFKSRVCELIYRHSKKLEKLQKQGDIIESLLDY